MQLSVSGGAKAWRTCLPVPSVLQGFLHFKSVTLKLRYLTIYKYFYYLLLEILPKTPPLQYGYKSSYTESLRSR